MNKKILYITTAYILKNSSAAIRNNSLVKGLVELGYEVNVYTIQWPSDMSSDYFLNESNGKIHFTFLNRLKNISKIKKKTTTSNKSVKLAKLRALLKKIVFFPDECSEWIKTFPYNTVDKYDVVITSSDHKTAHYIGLKIKRENPNVNWIQIWGDPWSSDVNTLSIMRKYIAGCEKKLLNAADKIIYVSSATAGALKVTYPELSKKIYYVPRGYYNSFIDNSDNSYNKESIIQIAYTGVISFGRNIFALAETIKKENLSHRFLIKVYGNCSFEVEKKLREYPFIKLNKGLDFEHMSNIYQEASILLYLSNKKGTTQIPGKLFDYMGTTKPILCLVDNETDEISMMLKEYDRCFVVENTVNSIRMKMDEIMSLSSKSFSPEERYSPSTVAKQVVNLITK